MRKIMIFSFVLLASFSASAQGIHLGPGDSLTIGFNEVQGCRFLEPTVAGGTVYVGFGSDILASGESLRLEMFENNFNEPSLVSQVFSPGSSLTYVGVTSNGSWLDFQGFVRVSVLSGSVDVGYANFFVRPDPFRECYNFVVVPEPSETILVTIGGIAGALLWIRRQKE